MKPNRLFHIAYHVVTSNGYGLPVLFTGKPGRAKTAVARAWARSKGVPFLHLSPGQKGEGYFGVVPVPVKDENGNDVLRFPPNDVIRQMCNGGYGLILVDEVRSAPRGIRPALLGLLQEREFGDVELPPGVRVIGASNATADATNGSPLSAPEANRMCHVNWHGFDADQMMAHFASTSDEIRFDKGNDIDPKKLEKAKAIQAKVDALRPSLRPYAAQQVFTFVKKKPSVVNGKHVGDAMHNMPKSSTDKVDGPWCSERSWSNVVEVLWTYRALRKIGELSDCPASEQEDSDLQVLLEGLVGGVGSELLMWISEQDLPDYGRWLSGQEEVTFEKGRDDRAFLIFAGAGYFIKDLPNQTAADQTVRRQMAASFFQMALKHAPTVGFEVVMAGVKIVQDNAIATGSQMDMTSKPALEFLSKYTEKTRALQSGK